MARTPKLTGFFEIVPAAPPTANITDNQDLSGSSLFSNNSWYQRIVQGSSTRLTRYREYDSMDETVEIARALDTIAEEMTGYDLATNSPLLLDFQQDDERIKPAVIETLRSALRVWVNIHNLTDRLFDIARSSIKYGDCFFIKGKLGERWVFVHARHVLAANVNANDVTDVRGWLINTDYKEMGAQVQAEYNQSNNAHAEPFQASDIVRFSHSNQMSDSAPFGDSVLRPVYKAFKQQELLEDAIIIYRITRAPERRVFYMDTGKLHQSRVKQYLESVKNELKQKKIPTRNGAAGSSQVESIYNPQSMTEDFFFAQSPNGKGSRVEVLPGGCFAMDTLVSLMDGRELSIADIEKEINDGNILWTYSCDEFTGEIKPGLITWAGVTQQSAKVMKITLDNGEEIICTPDHKFPLIGRGFVRADELVVDESLIPFNKRFAKISSTSNSEYEQVYDVSTKTWEYTHRMVGRNIDLERMVYEQDFEDGDVIHHADCDRFNNNPENLKLMSFKDHALYHKSIGFTPEQQRMGTVAAKKALEELKLDPNKYAAYLNKKKASRDLYLQELTDVRKLELNNSVREGVLNYINSLTPEERERRDDVSRANRLLGGNSHRLKMATDPEYRNEMRRRQSLGWTDEMREEAAIRGSARMAELRSDENWVRSQQIRHQESQCPVLTESMLKFFIDQIRDKTSHQVSLKDVVVAFNSNKDMMSEWLTHNGHKTIPNVDVSKGISTTIVSNSIKDHGYTGWSQFRKEHGLFNHRVVKIEYLEDRIEVGTLTIDDQELFHNHHTFALACGVFTKNSGLGELSDLEYFQQKVFRGLRIPTSYMPSGQSDNPIFSDGRIGQSYIEELRFALYVGRLQKNIERTLTEEFIKFLSDMDIQVDPTLIKLRLPEAANFGKYRQQELDSALLNTYSNAEGSKALSQRFMLGRYLQLSAAEIATNERLVAEERGIDPNDPQFLQKIYSENADDMDGGGLGDLGTGGDFGMDMSSGLDGDLGDDLDMPDDADPTMTADTPTTPDEEK